MAGAKRPRARFVISGKICLALAIVIVSRVFYLQTLRSAELKNKAEKVTECSFKETIPRGTIYDRNGSPLAQSLPTYSCAVMRKYTNNFGKLAEILSKHIGISKADLHKQWNSGKNFFYIKRKIDPETARICAEEISSKNLTGAVFNVEDTRFYPGGSLALDLLGSVSREGNGAGGIEALFNDYLLPPAAISEKVVRDRMGNIISREDNNADKEQEFPSDIYLTIDSAVQYQAEKTLAAAVEKSKAKGGMIIVQETSSGEIISAASSPQKTAQPMIFQWVYEPGSTFKVITISAALETNAVKETDAFFCENGKWQFSPKVSIGDHEKHGTLTVPEIIKYSSNICSAKIALKMDPRDFHSYIRAYGFGTKTSVGFPGESAGLLLNPAKWKPLDTAVMAYGHSISVTGVQLVSAFSAIANGGKLMEPQIIKKIAGQDGKIKYKNAPRFLRRVIEPLTAQKITAMMRLVTDPDGTAPAAKIRGYSVAGKTGTTKKLDKSGKYTSAAHIASFCGFFPTANPKFTVLVVLDEPKTSAYGGTVAAPAFKEIAKLLISIYGVKPDIKDET